MHPNASSPCTEPLVDISVVIPTYRRGTVLLDTLAYLFELDPPPCEVLIVDQTEWPEPEVAEALAQMETEGRIRWLRHAPPSIPQAMNRGLLEARGSIVLFLDDDIIPQPDLVAHHRQAYQAHPEAWAVAGRILQPEDDESMASSAPLPDSHASFLRQDLDFSFASSHPVWLTNVMAGHLSINRARAIALGGFDENFIPPVSFRFETEFAKRLIEAGGKIRFEPQASLRHLRAGSGGTRAQGSHLTSASPVHGVGDYYYAKRWGKGWSRCRYIARRPFREVCTRFHLTHPWWIPVKLVGELRAMALAGRLSRKGPALLASTEGASEASGAPKAFYDDQYRGNQYAASAESGHSFQDRLASLIHQYGDASGRWLEVGSGRGPLQDVVEDYVGIDLAESAAAFMHKPFHCASAEVLPFPEDQFDGIWSYAVLEHVENPEKAFEEMRRVVKPGGILVLAPAWQCRPWAGRDYAWKSYAELPLLDRIKKASIPIRDSVAFRALRVVPSRLLHGVSLALRHEPIPFYSRRLIPNYGEYRVADADAIQSMDPFDVMLWFHSRGDQVVSHPGWRQKFAIRNGPVVIQVGDS